MKKNITFGRHLLFHWWKGINVNIIKLSSKTILGILKKLGVINEILHRNTNKNLNFEFEIYNELVRAQSFNDYYVNVGAKLAESINKNNNNSSF